MTTLSRLLIARLVLRLNFNTINTNKENNRLPFDFDCKCKFCVSEFCFDHCKYIKSYITNSKFLVLHSTSCPPCKIQNVIYLIFCNKCGIQYVGKTEQCLKDRANSHRHQIKNGVNSNILLYKHFNTDCKISDYRYKIIEVVNKNDDILDRENYWISKLMTIYPFGMNNQIKGVGNILYKDFFKSDFENPFFKIPHKKRRPGRHGNRIQNSLNKKKNRSDINKICHNLFSLYKNFGIKKLKDSLKSLQKKTFCPLVEYIQNNVNNFNTKFKNIIFAYMGYIRSSCQKSKDNPVKDVIISTLKYSSKILDKININSLINSKIVKSKLPDSCQVVSPMIVYSFDKPVGLTICNYNKVLDNLSDCDIFDDNRCLCERVCAGTHVNSQNLIEFVYSPVGHIVTGKVELIKYLVNDRLAELCGKGYKFRIGNGKITWNKILYDITCSINKLKDKLVNKTRCAIDEITIWSNCLLKLVKSKFYSLKNKFNLNEFVNYNYKDLQQELKILHKHFVITTIDKANNNYSFICKKFYIANIKNELGIGGNLLHKNINGNSVYEAQINLNKENLIIEHTNINKEFNIKLSVKNECISKLYMIPKFHKRPYKFRYIAGAKFATTKPLSIQVVKCLKYLKCTHKRYCDTIKLRTGFNYYWSVDNSLEVVDKINNLSKVTSVHSFDFSTLYTNLPLDQVCSELYFIIDLHFDRFVNRGNYYLNVHSYFDTVTLSSTPTSAIHFSRDKLKDAIKFLLYNTYVRFGPYIFKQILGIPMGGNASPLIADIFLLSLEFKFMRDLVDKSKKNNLKDKLNLAKSLSINSRYIDDILVCNLQNFSEIAKAIYPNSIPLTESNLNDKVENFLDINICINNEKCILKIYNKVDDFNFSVITFPFPSSSIDDKIAYNCFYSQLVRYSYICSKLDDFWARARTLFHLLVDRGYDKKKLLRKFSLFKVNYCDIILKFNINSFKQEFLT